jgi:putative endonuclease
MIYFVYILTDRQNTVLRTGVTSDVEARVCERHEQLLPRFTGHYDDFKLVYYEAWEDPAVAMTREQRIKAGSREETVHLIDGFNRQWRDLYEEI